MLASEGAPYFRSRFLKFNIEEFRKNVDITKGKNYGRSEDVIVQFVANAYVGIVEWWLKNGMPTSCYGRTSGGFVGADFIIASKFKG